VFQCQVISETDGCDANEHVTLIGSLYMKYVTALVSHSGRSESEKWKVYFSKLKVT